MKFRNQHPDGNKVESQMTPMIDVVFQLLIFFMCTLKIMEPEGDFSINMPLGHAAEQDIADAELQPLKVRLEANPDTGVLTRLSLNGADLGAGEQAFQRLNDEINSIVLAMQNAGPAGDGSGADAQEVELEPDFNLDYRYIIQAIGACSGRRTADNSIVPLLNAIKFAPIKDAPLQ